MASREGAARGARSTAVDAGAADVVVDDDGVWVTAPLAGAIAQRRPVPTAGGVSSATVWPLPIDAALPATIADLLTRRRATPRLVALAELVAVLGELRHGAQRRSSAGRCPDATRVA